VGVVGDPRASRVEPLLAALFVAASLTLVLLHVGGDSATSDEPVHIASAVEMVRQGTGRWNVEHPPLAKAIAGLALTGVPLELPPNAFEDTRHASILYRFLFENRTPGDWILLRARLPFALLLGALLLAVRGIANRLLGPPAGLFALALAAFDPNLIAHAGVVHTDVAVTLFAVVGILPLLSLADPERRAAPVLLGLAWGAAMLSKYDAPLLVLATLPVLWLAPGIRGRGRLVAVRLLAAIGVAALVTVAGFAAAYRHQSAADREALAKDRLLVRGRSPAALRVADAVGRVLPPAENAVTGALSVVLQSRVGAGVNYFLGRISKDGSPLYFPVALLTKAPLGLLLAAFVGAISPPGRRLALALGAGLLLFLLASARSTYNIGVRHVLVAFPFAALIGAAAAKAGRVRAAVVGLFVAVEAGETLRVHPHELSFLNVAAGGVQAGRRLFADSNVDWGQDLARLASAAPRYGKPPLPTVVFGGDLPRRYAPFLRAVAPGDEDREDAVIALGEVPFAIGPELLETKGSPEARRLAELRAALKERGTRIGEIGGSIGIWKLERARLAAR
jgi:4-amino-4-deoxy-L-arabinose transferase-like glycosyltransferase